MHRAILEPLSPARYKVQFTASAALRDKLERLQALMRSEVPDGDLAAIIERAVTEKLERLEARRFSKTNAPRKDLRQTAISAASRQIPPASAASSSRQIPAASAASRHIPATSSASRHIPAAVRRAVLEREGSRCGYVNEQGRRCSERHRLEFHHRHPFGMGGDHAENVGLLCRAHNRLVAEQDYGTRVMSRHSRPVQSASRSQSAGRGNPAAASPP